MLQVTLLCENARNDTRTMLALKEDNVVTRCFALNLHHIVGAI